MSNLKIKKMNAMALVLTLLLLSIMTIMVMQIVMPVQVKWKITQALKQRYRLSQILFAISRTQMAPHLAYSLQHCQIKPRSLAAWEQVSAIQWQAFHPCQLTNTPLLSWLVEPLETLPCDKKEKKPALQLFFYRYTFKAKSSNLSLPLVQSIYLIVPKGCYYHGKKYQTQRLSWYVSP